MNLLNSYEPVFLLIFGYIDNPVKEWTDPQTDPIEVTFSGLTPVVFMSFFYRCRVANPYAHENSPAILVLPNWCTNVLL